MMFATKVRTWLAAIALAALALTARVSFADEMKVPTTAAEHEAMAKKYRDEAAEHRKLAEYHRAMAAAYAEAHQPTNGPTPNTAVTKMKKHCEAIAKDADKLAADADKAADYHELRAKELKGK